MTRVHREPTADDRDPVAAPITDWLWSYFVELSSRRGRTLTALDFGCGNADLVGMSLEQRIGDFHGVDTYYGEGTFRADPTGRPLPNATAERVTVIVPGERLPFDDATFDFVCSSQVLEHVEDLAWTIAEIARVTKDDGIHLHTFPTTEVVVEGHLGVPVIHRLPRRFRPMWAKRFYRRAHFADRAATFDRWWADMGPFLETKTFYRSMRRYEAEMSRSFSVRHVEREKLRFHLERSRFHRLAPLSRIVPVRLEHRRVGAALELRPANRMPTGADTPARGVHS